MTKIILCVPGIWQSADDLRKALAESDSSFSYQGDTIQQTGSARTAEIDFCKNKATTAQVFKDTSFGRFEQEELSAIDNHQSVVYAIISGGDIASVQYALQLGKVLLEVGGLAIKLETAGITHTKTYWLETPEDEINELVQTFVVFVEHDQQLVSCGMHQFGFPDAIIGLSAAEDPDYFLQNFLLYLLIEEPIIVDGNTFQIEQDTDRFILDKVPSAVFYEEDDLYYNPNDFWLIRSDPD